MSIVNILSKIKKEIPDSVLDITEFSGEHILHFKGRDILTVLTKLKDYGFNFMADITAIDNLTLGGFERFAVCYHLLCHQTADRLTVKAYISEEKPSLPSVETLWKTADWQERVIYDLYGIINHSGGVQGGHYTSFVKMSNDKWYHFNDTLVQKVNNINEQAFAFAVGESIAQIIPDFLKMAETYIPELKK